MAKTNFSKSLAAATILVVGAATSSAQVGKDVLLEFDHDTKSHSWANSYLLALMSYYAYASRPGINQATFEKEFKDRFAGWGASAFDFVNDAKTGANAAIVTTPEAVLVIFRGTETFYGKYFRSLPGIRQEDWITDFKLSMYFPPGWGQNVGVHRGFYNAAMAVYQKLRERVRNRAGSTKKVWIAGHSLGGVMSVLTAHRLRAFGGTPVQGVYTYGSPRVGNLYFTQKYGPLQSNTHRWANYGDTVSMNFPGTPGPITGYRHVGKNNNIHMDGKIILGQNMEMIMPPIPGNHDMRKYIWRIYDKLPKSVHEKMPSPAQVGVGPRM